MPSTHLMFVKGFNCLLGERNVEESGVETIQEEG